MCPKFLVSVKPRRRGLATRREGPERPLRAVDRKCYRLPGQEPKKELGKNCLPHLSRGIT